MDAQRTVRQSPSGPNTGARPFSVQFGSSRIDPGQFMIPFTSGEDDPASDVPHAQALVPYDATLANLSLRTTSGVTSGSFPCTVTVLRVPKGSSVGEDTEVVAVLAPGDYYSEDDIHTALFSRGDGVALRMDTGGASAAGLIATVLFG